MSKPIEAILAPRSQDGSRVDTYSIADETVSDYDD